MNDKDIVIKVEGLSKRYRIGKHGLYTYQTLRDTLTNAISAPFRKLLNLKSKTKNSEYIWALKDVSFQVKQGEIVGIIGPNGAGKTTLLKILSRITEPTQGYAEIYGRVGSLLEIGTGFHPELTGRENIFLNGAILGMRKAEIERKFDEIVAFAEIEKFLDTPVKYYSSGMYVRLAFAVAAHLEPEILFVDEVLAVGDAAFQKKCLGKMGDVAKEGRTVLFVSHNMAAINRLCHWGMWLDKGQVKMIGPTESVVSAYLSDSAKAEGERRWDNLEEAPGNEKIRLRAVRVINSDGKVSSTVTSHKPFYVEIEYDVLSPLSGARVGFFLLNSEGIVIIAPNDTEDENCETMLRQPGRYISRCRIPGNLLNAGSYTITPSADIPFVESIFFQDNAVRFQIERTEGAYSSRPDRLNAIICPSLEWKIIIKKDGNSE